LSGGLDTPGFATAVEVLGDHIFVADGVYGVQVIDITSPANPCFGIEDSEHIGIER